MMDDGTINYWLDNAKGKDKMPEKPKTEFDTTCPICGEEWFYCEHQIWDVAKKCREEGAKALISKLEDKLAEDWENGEEQNSGYYLLWLKAELEKEVKK